MRTDELVGREAVLTELSDAINGIAVRGDALLIVGEAGIGKSACLLAVETMARAAGHLILETAGSEGEINLAFAGLHRLLRPLLASAGALPDVQRRALLTAFGMDYGDRGDRFVVSVATLNLLRAASEHRALVITADDLQWLDEETRHVLAFVARRIEGHRLVLVGALTSIECLPDLRDAFRHLRLDRIDESAAHLLLSHRAPELDGPQREWVVSHSAGNPLALVELANVSASIAVTQTDPISALLSLPPALERAFGGRVHDLPKSERDVLLVAAVASDASLQEIVAATALLSSHDVTAAALEIPQALGLLTFDETRVHFAHPLVKTAIVQKESVSRRQAAHRALGAVITVSSYRRAWHRALGTSAHNDAIAAELEATTPTSIRRGHSAAAIMALERAAQLTTTPAERGRRLLLAARHAARLGRPDIVVRLLDIAVSGELSAFDRVRAELLREQFDGPIVGDSNRVMQLCNIARRAAAAGDTELALEVAYAAGQRRCAAPVSASALSEVVSVAGSLARKSHDAPAVAVLALADPIGHGRAVLSMLADIDEETVSDGDALSAYAAAARAVGHYSAASKLLDRAEINFRARGLLGMLAHNQCIAADLRLDLGEWDRAAAALAEFEALGAASAPPNGRAHTLAVAKISALRGEPATALELLADAEHSSPARSSAGYMARAQVVRGIAYLSSGNHLEAYTALNRVFEPDDPSHHFLEQFGAVAYLAEAAVHTGRQGRARDVMERMQPMADASGSPFLSAQLSYARAVLAPDDIAERFFLAALASDAVSAPWPRARIQLAYGRWLRRQQRVTQSRVPLQAALTILEWLGASRWAEEALDELKASGVYGQERHDELVPNLLSAQELKIARLAAQGLSNREIAQQLYLSPRTVSSHLYRIFPKLGISTRNQIASRLDEEYSDSDVG
jgi:DNA-binding CsgD family transcriptional regulator